jgi:hypothetical protein
VRRRCSAPPVAAPWLSGGPARVVIESDLSYASGANLAAADGLLPEVPGSHEVGRAPAVDDFGADRDDPAV